MINRTRIPRKLKKRMKHSIIIMDLASIPVGWNVEDWMKVYKRTGVIIYQDSKPEVYRANKLDFKYRFQI